jgi:hypothetical protein
MRYKRMKEGDVPLLLLVWNTIPSVRFPGVDRDEEISYRIAESTEKSGLVTRPPQIEQASIRSVTIELTFSIPVVQRMDS